MKNILLPTDFSDNSWNAIVYALNFYKDANCNFYLLHVSKLSAVVTNDYPYIPAQGIIEDVYIKPVKKQLRAVLKKISENFFKNKKHNFYTLTEHNFFIESLREHLEEKKVDVKFEKLKQNEREEPKLKEDLISKLEDFDIDLNKKN